MSNLNADPLYQKLREITDKHNLKTMKRILLKGARVLQKEAQKEAKLKIGSSGIRAGFRKGKIKLYSIDKGIKITPYKKQSNLSNEAVAATHILGDFRLKYFEMGTKERRTKTTNRSTGRIQKSKYNFFSSAISRKTTEAYNVIKKEFESL